MSSNDEKFINTHYLNYTKNTFLKYFKEDLLLKKEEYSNELAGMGFYRLTYDYFNKTTYQIIFEYERLRFTIRIKRGNEISNFFALHKELSNSLQEDYIDNAIYILKNEIDNNELKFFHVPKK